MSDKTFRAMIDCDRYGDPRIPVSAVAFSHPEAFISLRIGAGGNTGQYVVYLNAASARAMAGALMDAASFVETTDQVKSEAACSHCERPADFAGPCGVGGCPIGADL